MSVNTNNENRPGANRALFWPSDPLTSIDSPGSPCWKVAPERITGSEVGPPDRPSVPFCWSLVLLFTSCGLLPSPHARKALARTFLLFLFGRKECSKDWGAPQRRSRERGGPGSNGVMKSVSQQGAAYPNNDMKPLLAQCYTNKTHKGKSTALYMKFYINIHQAHAHESWLLTLPH